MKIKNISVGMFIVFSLGYASLVAANDKNSSVTEYKGNLYEKDRVFPALETGINTVLDGILISSKKTHLSKKQAIFLSEYVRQNKLFCQKGFDKKWMSQLQINLALLEKTENNRIAPAVNKKMQALFSARQC